MYELSRYSKGPLAYATTYVDMGGVFSNLDIFHFPPAAAIFSDNQGPIEPPFGSRISSVMTGMLLRLTVSTREIKEILKVAFNRGSSQQGKARRAAVGWRFSLVSCLEGVS